MKDENKKIQRYKLAVEQVRYEANLAWQNFRTYLIAHAILMAFLLRYSFDYESLSSNISVLIASLVGLFLCVPWRATSLRNSAYHSFRMAQARELEPEGWDYICGRGQKFASGSSVKADGDDHRIPWLGRVLRRPIAAKAIVYTFAIVYALILINGLLSLSSHLSMPSIHIETIRFLKAFSVIIALSGTILLAVGLKVTAGIDRKLSAELQTEKKEVIIPTEVVQRSRLIIAGLILISISALSQLFFIMFY